MARSTTIRVKNSTGSLINANKIVYITGFDSSGVEPVNTIALASHNNSSTMPAVGITLEDIEDGEISTVKVNGLIGGLDTSRQNANDPVYVGINGNITYQNPLDSGEQSQQLGTVAKIGISDGQILLFPLEVRNQVRHIDLADVLPDQHHTQAHAHTHNVSGLDPLSHSVLDDLEQDTHTQYILADGSRTITGAQTISGGVIISASSFPDDPADGQLVYRTDLDWLFRYDSGRTKWLGELESDGAGHNGTITASVGTYLSRFDGLAMSNVSGIYMPYNMTIIGVSMVWANPGSAPGTSTIQFIRNGSEVGTHTFSGGTTTSSMILNIDFTSGILAFRLVIATNNIANVQLRVWFRRRAT